MEQNSNYCEDTDYVNIHGQDIKVLLCEKTGKILIPIDALKNMGFRVYRKSQYSRLLVGEDQFSREFDLYMLQAAKTYMMEKQISFNEAAVFRSIENCKKILIQESTNFAQNHVISNNDDSISITTNLHETRTHNSRSMYSHNDSNHKFSNRRSVSASRQSFDKHYSNSYEKKDQDLNSSYELKKPKVHFNVSPQNSQNGEERWSPNFQNKPKLEHLVHIEMKKGEHKLLITSIDPLNNCVWAQDKENLDTLLEINTKVEEDIKTQKSISRNLILNQIYLAQEDDAWYRCKVIKFKPLRVFFVDYGNIAEVDEVKEASEELRKFLCQSVKLRFDDPTYVPNLYDEIFVNVYKYEKGIYYVSIKEDLNKEIKISASTPPKKEFSKETKKVSEPPLRPPVAPVPQEPKFFGKPSPLCSLQDGQRVMIISHIDGQLALRTKECCTKSSEVQKIIGEMNPTPVKSVEKDQMVLCKRKDMYQRAIVTNVQGNIVELDLIDYFGTLEVELSCIYHITESLAKEPAAYLLSPPLKDFTEESVELINKLIETRAKCTVIFNESGFDLQLADGLLSKKLKCQEPDPNRFMKEQLSLLTLNLGSVNYVLSHVKDKDNVTIFSADLIQTHLEKIMKTELQFEEPYEPIVGEVCLGFFQDSWSRCVIQRIMKFQYEVLYIDFGNVEIVEGKHLKKLPDDSKIPPILGIPCRVLGLPNRKNIDELLKNCVEGSYDMIIKKRVGDTYEIEIPALSEELEESNLC